MKTRDVALATMFATLYAVGVIWPLGFMGVQCRLSCALIPLIALFGWPSTIGITIGHFVYNSFSPIGFLDYFSPLIFFIPRLLIQKYGIKAMPIHTIAVATWVPFILNQAFGVPLILNIITVGIGELIAEWYLGYLGLFPRVQKRWI